MIKVKTGTCSDCSKSGRIIAGRCQTCYWKYRSKIKRSTDKGKQIDQESKEFKKELTEWFNLKLEQRPGWCENCGATLFVSMIINPRAIICHIVPKRHFPEVATHTDNVFYGCLSCHHKYDNGGAHGLTALPLIRSRYAKFSHLIKPENWHYLPDYLTT